MAADTVTAEFGLSFRILIAILALATLGASWGLLDTAVDDVEDTNMTNTTEAERGQRYVGLAWSQFAPFVAVFAIGLSLVAGAAREARRP